MKFAYILLLVILTALLVFLSGSWIYGSVPGSLYLQEPFVFPVGGQYVLAVETGAYLVDGSAPTGCYILTEPLAGHPYGSARWVWPVC